MTTPSLAIGVDLGATKIAAALVTRQGEVVATERRATAPEQGVEAVLNHLADSVQALLGQAPGPVAGVGIGSPGHIDSTKGIVHNAVNLHWTEIALAAEIRQRLPMALPVYVHKDANAEVLGEAYFGAGQGCQNLVYLGLGSGLGGGALVNGRLVTGDNFNAMEIGHISLDPAGRLCGCGNRGCAETVVSGPGLLAVARDYLARAAAVATTAVATTTVATTTVATTAPTILVNSANLTPDEVVSAAFKEDPLAQAVLAQVGAWLGMVMSICVATFNPGRIVIGGGVGRAAFDLLLPAAEVELRRRVLPPSYQQLEIVRSQLASSAVGAACLVWHHQ